MKAVDKCRNCGASIDIEPGKKIIKCNYCGTRYVLDNDELTTPQTPKQPAIQTKPEPNKVETKATQIVNIPPRPKVNILIAVVGFMLYFVVGIIYLVYVGYKQEQWDKKYGDAVKNNKR